MKLKQVLLITSVAIVLLTGGSKRAVGQAESGCPNPVDACNLFDPGSVVNGFCAYGACFEMSYGGEIRVVAADDRGDFPKTWFVWRTTGGRLENGTGIGDWCSLTDQTRRKTRVEISDSKVRCKTELVTSEHLYVEHFASNPTSGCLGWLECRLY